MLRRLALILPLLAFAATPLAAETVTVETVIETVEETWTSIDGAGNERALAAAPAPVPGSIARFGPFRVLDARRAALAGVTDQRAPAQFAALLAAYPGITQLEMIDCPGTLDDRANLALGRMIHARGLATHVPAGGSVRSGAVELFLAGVRRTAAPQAEFAVHSWEDEDGRQAADYPADAPENRKYLDYYREMGLAEAEARAFYAMTNSVPFERAKWLSSGELAQWVRIDQTPLSRVDSNRTLR